MTEIIISLPEEKLAIIREMASARGMSIEDFVRAGIDRLLGESGEDFEKAVDYVLKKNEDLYKRLA
jgi:cytidylate kinase